MENTNLIFFYFRIAVPDILDRMVLQTVWYLGGRFTLRLPTPQVQKPQSKLHRKYYHINITYRILTFFLCV